MQILFQIDARNDWENPDFTKYAKDIPFGDQTEYAKKLTQEVCDKRADIDARLDAQAVTLTIEAYLRTQTRENRQLFLRRYYYGDSVRRLSGLFGLTENTVKSRLFRLRAGLRDALLKEGIAV